MADDAFDQYNTESDDDIVQPRNADGITLNKQGIFTDMMVGGQSVRIVDPKFVESMQRRLISTENRVQALENDLRNLRDSIRRKDDMIARLKNLNYGDDRE